MFVSMLLQMPRAQRFTDSFNQALQSLVLSIMPHITIRYTEIPEEARSINLSLANFIKVENVPLCAKMKLNCLILTKNWICGDKYRLSIEVHLLCKFRVI